ncbi:TetR/AcrR family transcriptional regulator [Pseudonocardia nantongensis]|uniref:TetR/AcrR family transcriptional regulator n=1 Tax=Pseudonocardia nantongensis TaxID=1181885 RepID=UPI003979E33D
MPKVIGGSLATHRRQVRERVFAALRAQLYTGGFDTVTLSGIAAAAGVGRSAMYNHFPDRQALLVAFVEDEAAGYVTDLDAALAGVTSPTERLAVFARMQLRRLAEFHLPPGQALAGALDDQAYRRIAAHADPIGDRLTAILAAGAADGSMTADDAGLLAGMVAAALSSRKIVDVHPGELDTAVETAVRAILRMVEPAGAAHE